MMKSFLANSGATVFLLLLLSNDVEQNPGTVYIYIRTVSSELSWVMTWVRVRVPFVLIFSIYAASKSGCIDLESRNIGPFYRNKKYI